MWLGLSNSTHIPAEIKQKAYRNDIAAEMNMTYYDNSKPQNAQQTFSCIRSAELSTLIFITLHYVLTMPLSKVLLQDKFPLHNK